MEAHQGSRPPAGGERSTWIAFAGVMMIIIGSLDVIWGLAAIFPWFALAVALACVTAGALGLPARQQRLPLLAGESS